MFNCILKLPLVQKSLTMHSFSTKEVYLEPSRVSKMALIVKIEQLTIFAVPLIKAIADYIDSQLNSII